jgi:hypothetical protein
VVPIGVSSYVLIMAAQRAKVQLTFAMAMVKHWHGGINDTEGNPPVFTEHFHGLLARCQNAHLCRFENFWSSDLRKDPRRLFLGQQSAPRCPLNPH